MYEIGLAGEEVVVRANERACTWEELIDGMLLLETTDMDLPPKEMVCRYQEL